MIINKINEIEDKARLVDELQDLLEQQINLAHKGDPGGRRFGDLSLRMGFLVEEIARSKILELEEFRDRKNHIRRLYDSLYPTIATRKDETCRKLVRVIKGKKTIATYRDNI